MTTPHARPLVGVAFMLLAVACFALLDTVAKTLGATISVLIVVWFRYLFQAMVMAAVVLPTRGWRSLRTDHPGLHVLRGILLLSTTALGFFSLKYMPLAEFTAIIMLTPLAVVVMAALFLHERVEPLRWLLVLGGFAGAFLIIQPTGQAIGWAVLLPLSMVLVYAWFQILTSRMARGEDAMTMHFTTGWTGAGLMTLALPWFWHAIPDMEHWMLLCLAGVFGTVGHFLLIQAFRRAPAGTLAPFLYAQVGFALLLGWLLFGHMPGAMELWGIALIVACGASIAWMASRPAKATATLS
jgi:drug/metabolite transporter (DMT)-like permease